MSVKGPLSSADAVHMAVASDQTCRSMDAISQLIYVIPQQGTIAIKSINKTKVTETGGSASLNYMIGGCVAMNIPYPNKYYFTRTFYCSFLILAAQPPANEKPCSKIPVYHRDVWYGQFPVKKVGSSYIRSTRQEAIPWLRIVGLSL